MHLTTLQHWYHQPPGDWLLQLEQEQVNKWLPAVAAKSILQLGGVPEKPMINTHSRQDYYFVTPQVNSIHKKISLFADYDNLPFYPESIDLAFLIHVLEFSNNPQEILQQIFDVLAPNSQLFLFSFNAWSLWNLQRLLKKSDHYPWQGHFISPLKLQYWIKKQGYVTLKDKTLCFRAFSVKRPLSKTSLFFEALGQITVPMLGAVNVFLLEKRVYGMTAALQEGQICK